MKNKVLKNMLVFAAVAAICTSSAGLTSVCAEDDEDVVTITFEGDEESGDTTEEDMENGNVEEEGDADASPEEDEVPEPEGEDEGETEAENTWTGDGETGNDDSGDASGENSEVAYESAADDFMQYISRTTSEASENGTQVTAEETALWKYFYSYGGVSNIYMETICDWLDDYHRQKAVPYTGMIPALNIVWADDSDRSDIRLYGQFLISDYAVSGTSLIAVSDERIVGCMHLKQLSEKEYIVSKAEVLDDSNRFVSAQILADGDNRIMDGLLNSSVTVAKRSQFIRDFVGSAGLSLDSWMDLQGVVRPLYDNTVVSPEWLRNSALAETADQIVTVGTTDTWNATLMLHEKQEDGSWVCVLEVPALIGEEGLGKMCEGDVRTPCGVYGFREAFGLGPDPGSRLPYTPCDDTFWWVSDSSSDAYNRLVTTASYSDFNEESSERISDQPSAYRYAICTDYNAARRPLKGSGIFIQCMKENRYYTQGSIAVPADAMVQLVTRVRPEAVLVIDTGDNLVSQYERR